MSAAATLMFAEAGEAHAAVRRQAAAADRFAAVVAALVADPPGLVTTCARGSSDHAATYAKYLVETRIGVPVSSASPSVASVYGAAPDQPGGLCLAISQSGGSPDLVRTLEAAAAGGARTLALTNVAGSPLAQAAQWVLPLDAGPETSVAATKSYIASLAAVARIVALWSNDRALHEALERLPDALVEAWEADWTPLVGALADARGLFVIGRGYGFGIAQEAALKFKETCGLHAEAFSAAEVRHGPWALVGPDLPLLVFRQSDETAAGIDSLIEDALTRGATVLVAGGRDGAAIGLPVGSDHPAVEPILAIQSFYRAVEALARARGHDPDRPPHLRKVTETV